MDHSCSDVQTKNRQLLCLTDIQNCDCFSPEAEQRSQRCCSNEATTDDLTTNGSWSNSSISRSLQRAETLLKSTLNPGLKWLFQARTDNEEEEERNLVVAHNLVSRSSARLQRLQQALLTITAQWKQVPCTECGSLQVCVNATPVESSVLHLPSLSVLHGHYRALSKLLEQRSLLLFIHEYTRRARLAAAYVSRARQLLEGLRKPQEISWCSLRVDFSCLCHELRLHLNHWSCLSIKVQSDQFLRPSVAQYTRLLADIRNTLDLLALQALVVMEQCVGHVLSALALSELDEVPRDILEDVIAATDLYNQAVEEQRSSTQRRNAVLLSTCSWLSSRRVPYPAAFPVKDLVRIFAVHHADTAAARLHCWASEQTRYLCPLHTQRKSPPHPSELGNLHSNYLNSSSSQTPLHICDLQLDSTSWIKHQPAPVQHQQVQCQAQPVVAGSSVGDLKSEPSSPAVHQLSVPPLSDFHHQSTLELLFKILVSANDLLVPLMPHSPRHTPVKLSHRETEHSSVKAKPASSQLLSKAGPNERTKKATQKKATQGATADSVPPSPCIPDLMNEEPKGADQPECLQRPRSVQWLDLGQSLLFRDLFGWYHSLLWTHCHKALWLHLHVPGLGGAKGSINLFDINSRLHFLHAIDQASKIDLLPMECRTELENFSQQAFVRAAHSQWDYVVCKGLGSALKDKCQNKKNSEERGVASSSMQDDGLMTSDTTKLLLQLVPPLLSSLHRHASSDLLFPTLQRETLSLMLTTVQLSTFWVMSKSYQFLSSWSLNRFLLITQGDLKMLQRSLDQMVCQTKELLLDSDSNIHGLSHLLLKEQLTTLEKAASELQTFSSVVLKTFSGDCKRMSGEIFEEMMPPAGFWRVNPRTGLPSSPSEYVSLAAQSVIGQVLEGLAPLPDDARVQTLSITTTAFVEAWMEHILKQRIKFSVTGALQLKQDFDSIRDLIQSDRYGLSDELLRRLLGLRVFQQMDSAVMCLLQQPQVRPYLHHRAWEPFTRCCPSKSGRASCSDAVGSSITNLRSMEADDIPPSDPSVVASDIPSVSPPEPYLAPSAALGASQQDWLDLRIHSGARHWRLPGLHCLSKSEP
ncbi:uncharacterized protein ccdc142 isoform X2 [Synchiropus splendidus]|uniref:uncharacterized protein ccdc142 isoform X2 n=1 Tax=Synchiropus splendidus TaxID=270530 RepID=UPI00237ED736|nr:uncharacterized protein ccdc142 isoform X2 [Synchiropus splendidus]